MTDEVTAHGVKRFGPAGPGAARGPTRRGVPARRAGRIMPNRKRTSLLRESVQRVGGARGAAAAPAAGLKNDQQERTTTANNACIANGVSTVYLVGVKVSRALHEVQGKAGGAGATGVRHLSRLAAAARAQIGHGQTSPGESRDARGRRPGVPAGTCGRGGADSYPSQYPTPAGLPAPAVQTDGTCGTGSGDRRPH